MLKSARYFAAPNVELRRMIFDDTVLPVIGAQQARVVPDEAGAIVKGVSESGYHAILDGQPFPLRTFYTPG
ncbi:hypothetical protein [Paraburkholderia adhaesiva]|uniref:hypothetical protein n=1 Tax=Paraburkholderia adhaesiva TaxID=2883244 RepID=UPI001F209468|nr:hypothetical protein [Paraburkholderia adhaesiva]